jgi:small-conductance mechanosensitive channel
VLSAVGGLAAVDAAPSGVAVSVLRSIAVLAAAAASHWALRRLGRRLPRLIAKRRGANAPLPGWARWLELALAPPKAALWVAAVYDISGQFAALDRVRQMFAQILGMSLSAPLFTLNARTYSLQDVLALPAVLAVLWIAVSLVLVLVKSQLLRPAGVDPGAQETITRLGRHAIMLVGTIVVLQVWGIDVSSLTILASVLGVGIGFGLQNIANNFVSGLVMNLERPIRPGDFVQVGELSGTVERIGARSTVIRTLDRVTILVPNSPAQQGELLHRALRLAHHPGVGPQLCEESHA